MRLDYGSRAERTVADSDPVGFELVEEQRPRRAEEIR